MYNKRYKKSNKKIYGMCTIIVVLIYTISICYSTLQQQLEINGLVKVRRQENIRVTGVEVDSSTNATSNWEEYDVKNISAGISLPNEDSSITYRVKVTNFGNVDMGIYNIDGLNDKLEYEISEYTLKDKIEKSGHKKEFQITIKYKEGKYDENNTTYNILLNFDFRSYYKVTYTGFPDGASGLPKEVMERDTLRVDLSSYKDARYKITENEITLPSDKYTFEKNILTITTVEGDIEITYKKIPDIELVLRDNDENDYITEDLVGGMYRYQGTDDVNNWICFGTTKQTECTTDEGIDKYMYRIIGITPEGELKLIKETFVEENGNVSFVWNNFNTDCGANGEKCMWPDSMIYKRLNGISNGSKSGYNGDTNIFVENNYYGYLNNGSVWLNKIEDHNWKYGVLDSYSFDGNAVYALENGFKTITQAKISLINISDYLYAYKTNESDAGNPGNSTNAANSWIHYLKDSYNGEYCIEQPEHCNNNPNWPRFDYENTMINSKFVNHPWYYYYLKYSGSMFRDMTDGNWTTHYGNRPVFYLTKDTTIKSGTGDKTNPYIIE